jgi:hypothetical protein
MPSFNFPDNPLDNDIYSLNGITYKYVGTKQRWEIVPVPHNFETTDQLNTRDTANRNRANHTGTQAINTISELQTALDGKQPLGDYATAIQGAKADTALQVYQESIVFYLVPLEINAFPKTKAFILPYLPYNLKVTELVLELETAPTGSNFIVDINVDGVSFLSTKLSVDAGETSSTTASVAYVIDTTTFPNGQIAKGSSVSIDIDQVGSTVSGQNPTLIINGERY